MLYRDGRDTTIFMRLGASVGNARFTTCVPEIASKFAAMTGDGAAASSNGKYTTGSLVVYPGRYVSPAFGPRPSSQYRASGFGGDGGAWLFAAPQSSVNTASNTSIVRILPRWVWCQKTGAELLYVFQL